MRIAACVVPAVLTLASMAGAAVPAELEPLEFLIGEWASAGDGQPGTGAGIAVFRRDLQDRVIVRTSFAEYPATADTPASRHDDFMIVYVTPSGLRADYYDSEGHVIRYSVSSPGAGQVVFLSAPVTGEPTYRLTYKRLPTGVVEGAFEMADPGTAAFRPYVTWQARRTR